MLKLVSGTILAQIISVVITPFLTRLYTPDAFGIVAPFTSIVNLFSIIVCMRYDLAIMLPENDEEAANLLGISIGWAVLLSLFTLLTFRLAGRSFVEKLNVPELIPYLYWIPPMIFLVGIFQAQNYWNSRTKHFGRLSIAKVAGAATTQLVNLEAGIQGHATGGSLIRGSLIGQLLSTLFLTFQIGREDAVFFSKTIRWSKMQVVLARYKKFPLYSTWAALLNAISWQLPVFLLSYYFSSAVVGYYALGFRILQLPMSLVGGAIAQVFFQRASEAKLEGHLTQVVEDTFSWLVRIGMFPMFVLGIVGRDLYVIIFGNAWAEAGVYTQILSLWAFFWFIASPLSTLFSVLERQDFDLKINLALVIGRFISLSIGGQADNPRLALALFAMVGIVIYGYWSFAALRACKVEVKKIGAIYWRHFKSFVLPLGVLAVMYVAHFPLWAKAGWFLMASVMFILKIVKPLRYLVLKRQTTSLDGGRTS